MVLWVTGLLASTIGDSIHKMSPQYSGEPFDFGNHYVVTIPMLLAGGALPLLSLIYTLILGCVYSVKSHIKPAQSNLQPNQTTKTLS